MFMLLNLVRLISNSFFFHQIFSSEMNYDDQCGYVSDSDICFSQKNEQVTVAYNKDPSPVKLNLGVGAYRTEVMLQ